jgi:WD40 repeat protein
LAVIFAFALSLDCYAAQPRFSVPLPAWVGAVAYSTDGTLLAVGTADGMIHVLEAKNDHERAVLRGHTDAIASVVFTPDGKRVISGSFDQTARVWDVQLGELQMALDGHRGAVMSVAVAPDGKTLATASIDTSIKLWDCSDGELRATLSGHKSWVNSIAFSADGRRLVSGSSDGTVRIWDIVTRTALATLDADTVAGRTPGEVRSVALSPDGKTLAAGLRYGWVKLWTAPSWDRSRSFKAHDADVWAVGFDPRGSVLITGDGDWNRPGRVKFWDTRTTRAQALLVQFPTSGEVLSLACSPVERQIAVGCWNKQLEVWDLPEVIGVVR